MAGIQFPTGLHPNRLDSGAADSKSIFTYQIENGYNQALYVGDPIKVSNGYAQLATAGVNAIGVAEGFFWIDDTTKQPRESNRWIAGTSSANGTYEGQRNVGAVRVAVGRDRTYLIQANATVGQDLIGQYGYLTAEGTGSDINGRSLAKFDASGLATDTSVSATAGTVMVQIVGIPRIDGFTSAGAGETPTVNEPGVANTVIEVKLAPYYGLVPPAV